MLSLSQTQPAVQKVGTMGPVIPHLNVRPWAVLPLDLVLPHSECVVCSASPAGGPAGLTTPTPSSLPTQQAQTKTLVLTAFAKQTQMFVN